MNAQVLPGRMLEAPTADASGMDRRAFGEFVGPQGELASYALGWITGSDPHAGRITIGIGAGNPGGATFHAVVFPHQGSHAYALVDDPFEQVPEGGPDLTADEARAHEDLPFVWWVVDQVMDRDPRAWWLRHWVVGTRCVQTAQVFEQDEPILRVTHGDDGVWQLTGSSAAGPDGKFGHLWHAVDEDPTLRHVLDLPTGTRATRGNPVGEWTRTA